MSKLTALLALVLGLFLSATTTAYATDSRACSAILFRTLKLDPSISWDSEVLREGSPLTPERSRLVITQLLDDTSTLNREITNVLNDLKINSSQFWDKFLKIYDRVVPFSHGYLEIFTVANRILPKSGRIVDFGIGTGNGAALFAIHSPARVIIGIDVSAEGLRIAEKKLTAVLSKLPSDSPAHGFELKQGDVTAIHLAPKSVDGAVMINVLHAIPETHRLLVLKEIFNSLRGGGHLILNDPRAIVQQSNSTLGEFLTTVADSAAANGSPMTEYDFAFLSAINIRLMAGGAAKFLAPNELQDLARQAGFVIESVQESYYGSSTLLVLRKP